MELFQVLSNISSAIESTGQGLSTNFVDNSKKLLGYTAGLEIAWGFVLIIIEEGTLADGVAKAVRTVIIALICFSVITSWAWVAKDITQTSAALVKQAGKGRELGSIVAATLEQSMKNTDPGLVYSNSDQNNGGWVGWMRKWSELDIGTIFDKMLAGIVGLLNGGAVAIVTAICLLLIVLGNIVLWVGIIFGPLCLAFAPLKLTRKIAENWAGFTFASIMFPAVAATVLILCGGIFDALAAMTQKAGSTPLPNTVYSIASLVIAVVAIMVMLQVMNITKAIFGGGLGFDSPQMPNVQLKKS